MAAELTAVLFALAREARPFLRRARSPRRLHPAPCPVWRLAEGLLVAQTGMGAAATRTALEWLLSRPEHDRPRAVVAAGFCGGLADSLAVGDVVRPGRIVTPAGQAWEVACGSGTLVSVPAPVLDRAGREELRRRTGAVAADMESAAAAEVCRRAGVSFACVRAVSDDLRSPLPGELSDFTDGQRVRAGALVRCVLRRPGLLVDLGRLARHSARAAARLTEALNQRLGLPSGR